MSSVKLISTLFSLLICVILIGCAICFVIRYLSKRKKLSVHKNRGNRQETQGPNIRHINFPTPNNNASEVITLNETNNNQNPTAPSQSQQANSELNPPPSYEEICGNKP